MPDLQKPVKLMPIQQVRANKLLSPGGRPYGWETYIEQFTLIDESQWAVSTLNSLEPASPTGIKPTEKAKPEFLLKDNAHLQDNVKESTPAQPSAAVGEGKTQPSSSEAPIEGGPTIEESLARLLSGADGFTAAELRRMFGAFSRFKPVDATDINKNVLPEVLRQLNYMVPNDQAVHRLAKSSSQITTMDFDAFENVALKIAASEKEAVHAAFNELDTEKQDKVPCSALPDILRKLGLVIQKATIDEILASQPTAENAFMTSDDFMRFLASYKAAEGFTPSQVRKLRKVFAKLAVPTPGVEGGLALKASRTTLVDGLLQSFGEHVHGNLEHLLQNTSWHVTKSLPIGFHEFVAWGRRVQELEVNSFQKFFVGADSDGDGYISIDELIEVMHKMGFTLLSEAVDEFLADIDGHREMKFDFSSFFSFLKACQKRDGFTNQEIANLAESYKKYDYDGSGGIDQFELLDLMRYLGYDAHLKDVHRYMKQVDFNGNGVMDEGEFIRLMRLHREEELSKLSKVFHNNREYESGKLSVLDFERACRQADVKPEQEHVLIVMDEFNNPDALGFEEFIHVVDALRQRQIRTKRQRAGFSDKEFAIICKLFEKYNDGGKGKLDKGSIILLLIDAGVTMNSLDERKRVFEMFGDARNHALESGIEPDSVGRPSSPRLTFWPTVHLLRALLKMDEHGTMYKEEQAMIETGFEPKEVQDFRDIFLECCKLAAYGEDYDERHHDQERQEAAARSTNHRASSRRATMAVEPNSTKASLRRSSTLLPGAHDDAKFGLDANITLKDLLSGDINLQRASTQCLQVILTRKLGLKLKKEERKTLEEQVLKTSDNGEDSLDFADFLRLMRWILNTNFAHINDIAHTVAEAEKEAQKELLQSKGKMKGAAANVLTNVRSNRAAKRASV